MHGPEEKAAQRKCVFDTQLTSRDGCQVAGLQVVSSSVQVNREPKRVASVKLHFD